VKLAPTSSAAPHGLLPPLTTTIAAETVQGSGKVARLGNSLLGEHSLSGEPREGNRR